jgi:hypothetical protein
MASTVLTKPSTRVGRAARKEVTSGKRAYEGEQRRRASLQGHASYGLRLRDGREPDERRDAGRRDVGDGGQAQRQRPHLVDGHMPPDYQVLAQLPAGPDRINMQRALQTAAAKGGVENMRKDISQDSAQAIDQGVDAALDDFRKTVMIPGLAGNADVSRRCAMLFGPRPCSTR